MMRKVTIYLLLLICFPSTYISYKTFLSFRQQAIMTFDFNARRFNFATDQFVDDIIVDLPNISATTIPLKALKAKYLQETKKDSDQAKILLKKAINDNPYIKIPETELSRIYFDEQIADSAIYYGKKAFYGIPNNPIHFGHYVAALALKSDTLEIKKAYSQVSLKNDFLINKLYLIAMSSFVDEETSKNFLDAVDYAYVNDDEYKISYYMLKHGKNNVIKAINTGIIADSLFNNKQFKAASKKYLEAIKLNPSEPAYYQNAGNSFLQISELDYADYYLKKSIDSFNDRKGKSEYLYSISLLEQKNPKLACKYLRISYNDFKYKDALYLYNNFCKKGN